MDKKKKIIIFGSIGSVLLIVIIAAFVVLFTVTVTNVDMKSAKSLASKFEGAVAPSYLPEEFKYEYCIFNMKAVSDKEGAAEKDKEGVSIFNIMFTKLNLKDTAYTIYSTDENKTLEITMEKGGADDSSLNEVERIGNITLRASKRYDGILNADRIYGMFYHKVSAEISYTYKIYMKVKDGDIETAQNEVVKIMKSMVPEQKAEESAE